MNASVAWGGAILGWLTAAALGWCVLAIVHPALRSDRRARWCALPLAGLVGPALTGCLYWVWIELLRGVVAYLLVEWVVLAGAAVGAMVRWRGSERPVKVGLIPPGARLAAGVMLAAGAFAACSAAYAMAHVPHGEWDAVMMWNYKAAHLYHAAPGWEGPGLMPPSGDYPLLVSGNVARLWLYGGGINEAAPRVVAMGLYLALIGAVAMLAGLRRGAVAAMVGLLVLLAKVRMPQIVAWQYADVPLMAMIGGASVCVWVALEQSSHRRLWLFAAGLLAGAAAWTKNEGLVFAGLMLPIGGAALAWRAGWRSLMPLAAGAALPLLCVAWFKLGYAPLTDHLGGGVEIERDFLAMLRDPARHGVVAGAMLGELRRDTVGWLWLLAGAWLLLRGARWNLTATVWLAVLVPQVAAYYLVYLFTPHDIVWQVETSVYRLTFHVWPLLALAPALLARCEPLAAASGEA